MILAGFVRFQLHPQFISKYVIHIREYDWFVSDSKNDKIFSSTYDQITISMKLIYEL